MADETRCAFKYVKSGPGDLSGPSMMIQTERAINNICGLAYEGLDSSEEALSTAQQALTAAQNAQTTADNADAKAEQAIAAAQSAQDTADTASTVANQALSEAREAQSTADDNTARLDTLESDYETTKADLTEAVEKAQETADSASEKAESAQDLADTNSERLDSLDTSVAELEEKVEALDEDSCFTLDEETTDIDSFNGTAVRRYLTQNCTTVPSGVSAPYWVWTYIRCDTEKTLMWLRSTDGGLYSREGDFSAGKLQDGVDSFSFTSPHVDGGTFDGVVAVDDGELTVTSETAEVNGPYSGDTVGEFTFGLMVPITEDFEEGDEITFGDVLLATYEGGQFVVNEEAEIAGSACTLTVDTVDADEDDLTIYLSGTWNEVSGAYSTWTAWTAIAGGGSSSVDSNPTGTVIAFMGDDIPDGYLVCNGSEVSRTEYAALYAVIGDSCGTATDSSCFVLPDSRDKFLMGAGTNSPGVDVSQGLPEIWAREQFRGIFYAEEGTQTDTCMWANGAYTSEEEGTEAGRAIQAIDVDHYMQRVTFEASAWNSTYGSSSTVQPPALTAHFVIKY